MNLIDLLSLSEQQELTSQDVKAAFKAAGMTVRVADQKLKFRICQVSMEPYDKPRAFAAAAKLGLTDASGKLGGQLNQSYELIGYKPGVVVHR
jgi:hypothetical protein